MDTCYYDNSYLKRYNCIKKYDKLKKKKTKTLSEYIEEKKDNTLLDSKKIQEYSNYLDNKSLTNYNKNSLSLQIVRSTKDQYHETTKKNNNTNKDCKVIKNNFNYNIVKDGYLSRNNKETVLLNRTPHGYECLNKKKEFDLVSITRPIYWPDRGYTEISPVIDPNVNKFQTCYF